MDVNPNDIPNGYSCDAHRRLKGTISDPAERPRIGGVLRIMSCHEYPRGKEQACVGWLHNQLGEGNNLALRFKVAMGRIPANYALVGAQHETFEDTLPDGER